MNYNNAKKLAADFQHLVGDYDEGRRIDYVVVTPANGEDFERFTKLLI